MQRSDFQRGHKFSVAKHISNKHTSPCSTHQKINNLFRVDEKSIKKCRIYKLPTLRNVVNNMQDNSGSTILNNIVDNIEQCEQ